MAVRATTVPFSGGHDTTIDPHLAGLAKFKRLANARLDADGRMVSRANYTALAQTCYGSGSHVCYDLFEVDGRLCSLGDRRNLGHPTDVFEFVEGAAAAWKSTGVSGVALPPLLPRGTRLREVARPPDQKGGVSGFDVAAIAGFVLLVYNDDSAPPKGYSMLVRAGSGQMLVFQDMSSLSAPERSLKAIGLTTRMLVVGFDAATTNIRALRIDPASAETWTTVATPLLTDAGGFSVLATEKVVGSDEFVVASVSAGGNLKVRRYDSSAAVVTPSGGQYATIAGLVGNYLAVEADSSGNTITVAVVDGNTLKLYSWNLSTGAQIGTPPYTPTEVATETCQHVALTHPSSGTLQVVASVSTIGTPDVPRVMSWSHVIATGSFGTGNPAIGLKLNSGVVRMPTTTMVFGAVTEDSQTTPNLLVEQGFQGDILGTVAAKDLGFAMPPLDGGVPRIAVDTSRDPDRYYWVHGVQSADGSSIPVLCELALDDPGRRQVARVGRGAVISGACPVWYDGAQLVELGFTERPYIVSLTPGNGSGGLTGSAVYTYKVVHSWFDVLGRLQRSAESLPVDVTMAATNNTVTAVLSGPHTARHNRGSAPIGSSVRTELYRNRAIVTKTKAVLSASNGLDPPSASLSGKGFAISITDSSGTTVFDFTFSAGAVSSATVVSEISAVSGLTARITPTAVGGVLVLTSVESGSGVTILIYPRSANDIIGFSNSFGSVASGTTEIERGDVFHLTNSAFTTIGGNSGDRVTIVDVRDDDADTDGIASQSVIYTQLDSELSDVSPLPSDRVWAGVERVDTAGHPQRETWSVSKLLEPGFAPAFAEQGIPGFGGELIESIEAIVLEQQRRLLITKRGIWSVDGEGPALNGKGSFVSAMQIFTDGGLVEDGWRSLLKMRDGIWMQLGADKLYLVSPGGAPQWLGFPIRELLRTYPVIVAATLTTNDQVAAFALQSTDKSAGRIALYDLRTGAWTVDEISQVPVALADYQGRLCFADTTGVVYMQDSAAGSGAFVPLTADTHNALLFGVAGQGAVPTIMFVGLLLGECTLELLVNYDDGAGYVSAGTFALTVANGYTIGQTVREQFDLALEDCSQFSLRVTTTGSSGSAGLAFVALEVYAERDAGPALLGDSYRR